METAFGVVSLVVIVVLTIALWCLYHKLFKVFYFGNPIRAIIYEFISAFITAILIFSAAYAAFQSVLTSVSSSSGTIGKIVLVIIIVIVIISLKGKKDSGIKETKVDKREVVKEVVKVNEDEKKEKEKEALVCTKCGKTLQSNGKFCKYCGQKFD